MHLHAWSSWSSSWWSSWSPSWWSSWPPLRMMALGDGCAAFSFQSVASADTVSLLQIRPTLITIIILIIIFKILIFILIVFVASFFLFTVSFLWRKPCCVSYLHNPQSCQLRRSKVCHMAFVIILIKMIMVELMIWTAWCGKWMRTKWEQSQLWLWRSFWSSALMIGPQHWISVKLLTRSPDLGKYRRHASIWISSCRIYKISDGFRRVFLAGPQMSFTEKLTWLTKSDRHGSLMWLGKMLMLTMNGKNLMDNRQPISYHTRQSK